MGEGAHAFEATTMRSTRDSAANHILEIQLFLALFDRRARMLKAILVHSLTESTLKIVAQDHDLNTCTQKGKTCSRA